MALLSERQIAEIGTNLLGQTEEHSLGERLLIFLGANIGLTKVIIEVAEENACESAELLKASQEVQIAIFSMFSEGRQRKQNKDIAESN